MTGDTDPKFTAYKEKGQRLVHALIVFGLIVVAVVGGILFLVWSAK